MYYKQSINPAAGKLAEKFIQEDPARAAYFLETLPVHEALSLLGAVNAQTIVKCVSHMCAPRAGALLRRMNVKQTALVLSRLNLAHAAQIMNAFPEHYRKKVSPELDKDLTFRLENAALSGPESAAAMARGDYFSFKTDDKIKDILEKLKNVPRKKTPLIIYVTDKQNRLAGWFKTADMLFFAPDASAGSVMLKEPDFILASSSAADARKIFKEKESGEIAVTDEKKTLLGVLDAHKVLGEGQDAHASCCKKNFFDKRRFLWTAAVLLAFLAAILIKVN